jgi:hypothetical protein
MLPRRNSPGREDPGRYERRVGGAIAAQYGSSSGQKQQYFGRVDPFVMFAVVPIVMMAILFIWSDIAILGVVLIILALMVVAIDSWANRPVKKAAARDRDDY